MATERTTTITQDEQNPELIKLTLTETHNYEEEYPLPIWAGLLLRRSFNTNRSFESHNGTLETRSYQTVEDLRSDISGERNWRKLAIFGGATLPVGTAAAEMFGISQELASISPNVLTITMGVEAVAFLASVYFGYKIASRASFGLLLWNRALDSYRHTHFTVASIADETEEVKTENVQSDEVALA